MGSNFALNLLLSAGLKTMLELAQPGQSDTASIYEINYPEKPGQCKISEWAVAEIEAKWAKAEIKAFQVGHSRD
jgi:hypothetical protein